MSQWISAAFLASLLLVTHTVSGKTLLVMGDSLSAAYGVPVAEGWVSLLESRLKSLNHDYKVINESISGETTDGGLRRLPGILQRTAPDIIILELGANDGLRGFPVNIIQRNLETLIDLGKAANAQILLLGMHIPPNYGPLYTRKFHETFQAVAHSKNISLEPFFLDGVATKNEYMQADGLHPNAAGQPIILENIWRQLEPLLKNDE
jgi:acyl-CoA thioesterase-1